MDWLQVLAVMAGNAAIVIPLWLHLESRMDEQGRRIEDMMRDFHGKLERQDAEFKAHMLYEHKKG